MNRIGVFLGGCLLGAAIYGLSLNSKKWSDYSSQSFIHKSMLCPSLQKVQKKIDHTIIKSVKRIYINGVDRPYNGSLVPFKMGYWLYFREDIPLSQKSKKKRFSYDSCIRRASLDANFSQYGQVETVPLNTQSAEDPRAFQIEDALYLSFNAEADNEVYSRVMCVAKLQPDHLTPEFVWDLDINQQIVEKNWVPFCCPLREKDSLVSFEYSLNPHKVFHLCNKRQGEVFSEKINSHKSLQKISWARRWGTLRGGSPAILLDNQYIAFFHSSFEEDGRLWYVMGAYTFDATSPFRITAISKYPILFEGIYDSDPEALKKVIFPSGLVLAQQNGEEVLHLSCGENDSAVKIITFNREKLLASLDPVLDFQKND